MEKLILCTVVALVGVTSMAYLGDAGHRAITGSTRSGPHPSEGPAGSTASPEHNGPALSSQAGALGAAERAARASEAGRRATKLTNGPAETTARATAAIDRAASTGQRIPWHEVTEADLTGNLRVVARERVRHGHGSVIIERWTLARQDGRTFDAAVKLGPLAAAKAHAEQAYYRLDQLLGGDTTVPPTVARILPETEDTFGSMQVWADGASPRHLSEADEGGLLTNAALRRIYLLDYLAGNIDRNPSNLLWTSEGRPVSIDHGEAFMPFLSGPLRTIFTNNRKYSTYLYRPTEEFSEALRRTGLAQVAEALDGLDAAIIGGALHRFRSLQNSPDQFHGLGTRLASFTDDSWATPITNQITHSGPDLPGLQASDLDEINAVTANLPRTVPNADHTVATTSP